MVIHVDAPAAEPARADLANRGDVEALLRRFYGQVLVDRPIPRGTLWAQRGARSPPRP